MLTRREYFEGTTEEILAVCRECSTTWELGHVNGQELRDAGFELVDTAWTGLCQACEEKQTDASNAEYEALVRAHAELGRVHHTSHPATVEIPAGLGLELEGRKRFGFWVVAADGSPDGRERFGQNVRRIVGNLNANRGTNLLDNLADDGRQALVHGLVD